MKGPLNAQIESLTNRVAALEALVALLARLIPGSEETLEYLLDSGEGAELLAAHPALRELAEGVGNAL